MLASVLSFRGDNAWADTVWLDTIKVNLAQLPYGHPERNLAFGRTPLSIAGKTYPVGMGVIASSKIWIDLDHGTKAFKAEVGADDAGGGGAVKFVVAVDGEVVWQSGVMHKGDPAQKIDVENLLNKSFMLLVVENADGSYYGDKADWANARWETAWSNPDQAEAETNPPVVLTPPASPRPHLNNVLRYGARPKSPIQYTIPCTGQRPMKFEAVGLPQGLSFNPSKGWITGSVSKAGTYPVTLKASNAAGSASKSMEIVIGDALSLTPPMGWNSFNVWCTSCNQERILAAAHALVDSDLINHGFTYVTTDDGWQGQRGGKFNGIQANPKLYPDIRAAIAETHGLGLKFGLYSGPWVSSYSGYVGGTSDDPTGKWTRELSNAPDNGHHFGKYTMSKNDAQEWGSWGVDYLKYDWYPNEVKETADMSDSLRLSGRDIVYSISNSAKIENGPMLVKYAQVWRNSGDIRDNWASLCMNGFKYEGWDKFTGPGHWPDPDMMVLGNVGFERGWGSITHATHLTPDEQYSHTTLWSMLAAPLILGCDLTKLDDFTKGLLTNDEIIAVDQDPLGQAAKPVAGDYFHQVYARPLSDGSTAVAIFNMAPGKMKFHVSLDGLGVKGKTTVRDLWRQTDYPAGTTAIDQEINGHGVLALKLTPLR